MMSVKIRSILLAMNPFFSARSPCERFRTAIGFLFFLLQGNKWAIEKKKGRNHSSSSRGDWAINPTCWFKPRSWFVIQFFSFIADPFFILALVPLESAHHHFRHCVIFLQPIQARTSTRFPFFIMVFGQLWTEKKVKFELRKHLPNHSRNRGNLSR